MSNKSKRKKNEGLYSCLAIGILPSVAWCVKVMADNSTCLCAGALLPVPQCVTSTMIVAWKHAMGSDSHAHYAHWAMSLAFSIFLYI